MTKMRPAKKQTKCQETYICYSCGSEFNERRTSINIGIQLDDGEIICLCRSCLKDRYGIKL